MILAILVLTLACYLTLAVSLFLVLTLVVVLVILSAAYSTLVVFPDPLLNCLASLVWALD